MQEAAEDCTKSAIMIFGRSSSIRWPKVGGNIVRVYRRSEDFWRGGIHGLQGPLLVSRAEPKSRTSTAQKILLEVRNKPTQGTIISKYREDA
jgi:hypothetical protein